MRPSCASCARRALQKLKLTDLKRMKITDCRRWPTTWAVKQPGLKKQELLFAIPEQRRREATSHRRGVMELLSDATASCAAPTPTTSPAPTTSTCLPARRLQPRPATRSPARFASRARARIFALEEVEQINSSTRGRRRARADLFDNLTALYPTKKLRSSTTRRDDDAHHRHVCPIGWARF